MVGFGIFDKHTPREIIVVPPSVVMPPPLNAEESVIALTPEVYIVGKLGKTGASSSHLSQEIKARAHEIITRMIGGFFIQRL